MAESKSTDFPFEINDHSEKSWKFDLFLINGLWMDSECTAPSRYRRPRSDSPFCDCDYVPWLSVKPSFSPVHPSRRSAPHAHGTLTRYRSRSGRLAAPSCRSDRTPIETAL